VKGLLAALVLFAAACNVGETEPEHAGPRANYDAATPVRAAEVTRGTMTVTVTGPGRTQALREIHLRAPFTGELVALRFADGDSVGAGAVVGEIVSQNSHAALEGAKAMQAAARTDAEKADARRALELAQSGLVRQALRAPAAGVMLTHKANAGDFVSEGDEIATLAEAASMAFVAQIAQKDLPEIHPGAAVSIEMTSQRAPLAGVVHGLMPAPAGESLSVPVRIDLAKGSGLGVGLFGTAKIAVAQHPDALLVPRSAVLRDDISGVSHIAVIGKQDVVHWIAVTPGACADGQLEVAADELEAGARVVVSGHVGLPEGARVRVQS